MAQSQTKTPEFEIVSDMPGEKPTGKFTRLTNAQAPLEFQSCWFWFVLGGATALVLVWYLGRKR